MNLRKFRFYLKAIVIVLYTLPVGLLVIISSLVMKALTRFISPTFALLPIVLHLFHWVKLGWSGMTLLLLGVRVRRSGELPKLKTGMPVLYAGTHDTIIDAPVLAWFIGKSILNNWIVKTGIPGLGPILKAAGCLVTNRKGSKKEALALFDGQSELMHRFGYTLVSFASGSRSRDEFKSGSFQFAIDADIPIVVFAMSYSDDFDVLEGRGGVVYVSMSLLKDYDGLDADSVARLARKRADTMLDCHTI